MNQSKSVLHQMVLGYLKETSISLQTICGDTGLTIYWLQKLRADAIPAPSAQRLEKLFEYLAGISFRSVMDAAIALRKNKDLAK
jgi:hypothetical protein